MVDNPSTWANYFTSKQEKKNVKCRSHFEMDKHDSKFRREKEREKAESMRIVKTAVDVSNF